MNSSTNAFFARLLVSGAALILAVPGAVRAQKPAQDTTRKPVPRADSARVDTIRPVTPRPAPLFPVVDTSGPRPEIRPPLSPRRAFLYSLMLPGYAQSVLGRNRAGALEMAFEAVALSMVQIAAADVREARRMLADSVPVSYVDATGAPRITYRQTIYTQGLVRSRRSHLEDWIAVVIGNHLFSAADAFVAANLWDLPKEISLRVTPHTAEVALTVPW